MSLLNQYEFNTIEKKYGSSMRIIFSGVISGVVSTIIFFMLQTLLAQVFVDYLFGYLTENSYLNIMIIMLFGMVIFLIISIIVSILVTKQIKTISVIKSSIISIITNLFLWYVVSFVSLYIYDVNIFSKIRGWELIIVFPVILMYFSIYILNSVVIIWFLINITYNVLFVIFLLLFKEKELNIQIKQSDHKW